MAPLADRFCPNVHDAPVTAAAYDPWSGVLATADASGLVAITRAGESSPGLTFRPGAAVNGALGLIRGGTLVAVGDEDGTIGVYGTDNGAAWFQEVRDGARGRVRAMRGVAVSPEGARVASIAADGLLRIWSIERGDREIAWQGFGGSTVDFDERGSRILCLDAQGQPRLVDLLSHQGLPMDRLPTPAERAVFSLDGTLVITAGQSGLALLRVVDGVMVNSFATRGGSGILNVVQRPDGKQIGAVSQRSVHVFDMPDLAPADSGKHGAPEPSGAAYWGQSGWRVGGSDGLLHGGGSGSAGPVTVVGGFGDHRVAVHADTVAIWKRNRRMIEFAAPSRLREVQIDRDGQYVVAVPMRGNMVVYDCATGQKVFDGGPETNGTPSVGIGGSVVAAQLLSGGVRWWDLARDFALELPWPTAMTLSHGGTWLGVVTPRGAIRIIEPQTGKEAIPDPIPSAEVPARLLSFVNRRPDLLVVDADNVLAHYDLTISVREGRPCPARDVLQFPTPPDRIWGITGGRHAAVRLPEGGRCAILFVDLYDQTVVGEIPDLDPGAWVDAESGTVLEPARSAAILERGMDGTEQRVLRALIDDQWVCFGPRGLLDNSAAWAGALGG